LWNKGEGMGEEQHGISWKGGINRENHFEVDKPG
jgi:hypothetical protein